MGNALYVAIALGVAFTILGLVVAGRGYALLGLVEPQVAERFGLQPVAAGAH
ncbi:MAG: hypothetical protein WBC91_03620 [Phototrophicaceae bacterium]